MGMSSEPSCRVPFVYKDAAEFSQVFVGNSNHDIGRRILSQSKKH